MKTTNRKPKTAEKTAAPVRAKKASAETKHPIAGFTTPTFYNKLMGNVSLEVLDKLVEYINAYRNLFNGKNPKANNTSSLLNLFTWKDTPEGKMYWLRFDMEHRSKPLSALNDIQFAVSKEEPKKDVFNVSNSEINNIVINVPGYVLDTENSTPGKIVLKAVTTAVEEPKKPALPKTWKELKKISGYYVTSSSTIQDHCEEEFISNTDKNVFATKEQAEASQALAQLSQLREVYRQGWVPDWSNGDQLKYCIHYGDTLIKLTYMRQESQFLSFQSKVIAEQFLENFRDLIQQARPLMS